MELFVEADGGIYTQTLRKHEMSSKGDKDKLFLLSEDEVKKYLPNEDSRVYKTFKVMKIHDIFGENPIPFSLFKTVSFQLVYIWWLRTPGAGPCDAICVDEHGVINSKGNYVRREGCAVRPALYIHPECLSILKRTREGYVKLGGQKWQVLDEQKGLLLLKNRLVRMHKFDSYFNEYEHSEIRAYLNGELLNELFTEEERRMIMDTVVDGERSWSYPAHELQEMSYDKGGNKDE